MKPSPTTEQNTSQIDAHGRAILTLIAEQIQSPVGLTPQMRIDSLDIDSLDMVEIAQTLYDDFGIRLDAQSLHEATTLSDVLELVAAAGVVE